MDYVKVKDNEHLMRNTKSNCIVNTNKAEYEEYLTRRKLKKSEKNIDDNLLRNLTASLFISMLPLHEEDQDRFLCFAILGSIVFNNIDIRQFIIQV